MCLFRKWQEYVFVWLHDLLSPDWLKCAMPEILVLGGIQSAEVRFFVLRHDCKLVPSVGSHFLQCLQWPWFEPVEIGDSIYRLICGSQRFYILSCLYSRVQRNAHSKGLFTTLVWCFESDLFLAGLKWSLRWQLGDIWYHDTVTEIISILSFIISWIVVS